MTEDILISVKGLHTLESTEEEEIEVFSAGKYYFRDGKHYIFYDETVEDSGEVVKNRITLRDGFMEVQKKGPMNAKMIFEQDHKNTSWYDTPFGNLLAGIEVTAMQVTQQEDLLEVSVDYVLEVNYERIADCRIRIRVMSKDSGLFRLR